MGVKKSTISVSKWVLPLSFLAAMLVFFGMETISYGAPGSNLGSNLTQCANDPDNSGLVEMCQWITGALTTNNSLYAESDGVPQRWLFEHRSRGDVDVHTAVFQYTFTKGNVYSYDFLNNVDHTMPMSLINECGDLPPFANPDDCENAFHVGGSDVVIPSDPFDAVSLREHPPVRKLHFGCIQEGTTSPGCNVSIVSIDPPVHVPATNCFQNCGDSDAQITVHFSTNAVGSVANPAQHLIGMWFSGQLASAADPDGAGPAIGWGTGFGASSAPGSAYHVRLVSLDGQNVGGEDDQINSNVITAGHHTDLSVTKSCPATIHAGNDVSYTITVENNGPETATGVFIDDTLPLQTGVTFVSATTSKGTCNAPVGTLLHCDIGFMQPTDTATITVVVSVASTFSGASITDSVTVGGPITDTVTNNDTDSCTTTVFPPVGTPIDLSVVKTCPAGAIAGVPTNLTYNVTVTNNDSTFTATGVTLTDSLPGGITFVSATPTQGTCSQSAGVVTCPLGSLAAGATATVTIVVAEPTDPSFRGPLTDVATVSGDQSDGAPANNSSSCTTTVTGHTDISIVKGCPASATEDSLITYHITVNNAGPSASLDTHIQDILPNVSDVLQVSFVSATPSQGSCTFVVPDIVHCTLGTILPSGSATIDVVAQVNSGTAGSTLTNIAETHIHTPDEDTNHNNDTPPNCGLGACICNTTSTAPPAPVDLQVTKQDSPDPVAAGANLTYTITVTNSSSGTDATNVTLTDTLPAGVTFVSATPIAAATSLPQGTCSQLAGVVTCSLGTLPANPPNSTNPVIVTIVVTVNPSTRGTLTNTAVVAGSETESDLTNNTATATTQVFPQVGLFITKQDSPDPILTGNNLTYTVIAGNIGPSDATNVQVVDTLPPGAVSFVSATATQGSCTNNGNISVTCNLGTITPGNSVTITIVVNVTLAVSPGGNTTITNTADVSSTENPTDAQTQDTTTITSPPIAPVSVPTMTEWGMIIFMILAGNASVYHLRRKRRT